MSSIENSLAMEHKAYYDAERETGFISDIAMETPRFEYTYENRSLSSVPVRLTDEKCMEILERFMSPADLQVEQAKINIKQPKITGVISAKNNSVNGVSLKLTIEYNGDNGREVSHFHNVPLEQGEKAKLLDTFNKALDKYDVNKWLNNLLERNNLDISMQYHSEEYVPIQLINKNNGTVYEICENAVLVSSEETQKLVDLIGENISEKDRNSLDFAVIKNQVDKIDPSLYLSGVSLMNNKPIELDNNKTQSIKKEKTGIER